LSGLPATGNFPDEYLPTGKHHLRNESPNLIKDSERTPTEELHINQAASYISGKMHHPPDSLSFSQTGPGKLKANIDRKQSSFI
jgi:hypothetical protein